jgi:hypothetical protein
MLDFCTVCEINFWICALQSGAGGDDDCLLMVPMLMMVMMTSIVDRMMNAKTRMVIDDAVHLVVLLLLLLLLVCLFLFIQASSTSTSMSIGMSMIWMGTVKRAEGSIIRAIIIVIIIIIITITIIEPSSFVFLAIVGEVVVVLAVIVNTTDLFNINNTDINTNIIVSVVDTHFVTLIISVVCNAC